MNPLARLLLGRGAEADAAASVNSGTDRVTAAIGERPGFNPTENAEHALVAKALDRAELEELREDLRRAEEEASQHIPPMLIFLGLVLAVAVEVVGSVLILRAVGVPASERLPLSVALAATIIGITAAAARFTATPRNDVPPSGDKNPRNWRALLVLAAYSVFVVAVVVVRMAAGDHEDDEGAFTFAHAVILAATAIGPAWAVEAIVRKRRPSLQLRARVRALRARVREGERRLRRAESYVQRNARNKEAWDGEFARRKAAYATAHRLASAKRGGTDGAP
ncbi:MAG: hypothetical protein IT379_14720 [Deltaproteobacteria bacterium]|nr:hypothetical protein [Deltaproteobacteria bacterium]